MLQPDHVSEFCEFNQVQLREKHNKENKKQKTCTLPQRVTSVNTTTVSKSYKDYTAPSVFMTVNVDRDELCKGNRSNKCNLCRLSTSI